MVSEAKKKANAKYDKANYKHKVMKLHIRNDKDIIEWLESKDNINGYLKELVRNDMDNLTKLQYSSINI